MCNLISCDVIPVTWSATSTDVLSVTWSITWAPFTSSNHVICHVICQLTPSSHVMCLLAHLTPFRSRVGHFSVLHFLLVTWSITRITYFQSRDLSLQLTWRHSSHLISHLSSIDFFWARDLSLGSLDSLPVTWSITRAHLASFQSLNLFFCCLPCCCCLPPCHCCLRLVVVVVV